MSKNKINKEKVAILFNSIEFYSKAIGENTNEHEFEANSTELYKLIVGNNFKQSYSLNHNKNLSLDAQSDTCLLSYMQTYKFNQISMLNAYILVGDMLIKILDHDDLFDKITDALFNKGSLSPSLNIRKNSLEKLKTKHIEYKLQLVENVFLKILDSDIFEDIDQKYSLKKRALEGIIIIKQRQIKDFEEIQKTLEYIERELNEYKKILNNLPDFEISSTGQSGENLAKDTYLVTDESGNPLYKQHRNFFEKLDIVPERCPESLPARCNFYRKKPLTELEVQKYIPTEQFQILANQGHLEEYKSGTDYDSDTYNSSYSDSNSENVTNELCRQISELHTPLTGDHSSDSEEL